MASQTGLGRCRGPARLLLSADPPSRSPRSPRTVARGQWQVFGLAGTPAGKGRLLLAVASQALAGPVL